MPIVRGGQVFGVLTVQNRAAVLYAEEKSRRSRPSPWCWPRSWRRADCSTFPNSTNPSCAPTNPLTFRGEGLSEGVAVGRVVLHEPRVKVERMIADNPQEELKRLEDALSALRQSVDKMLDSSELDLTGEGREVIEAYRLFAQRSGLAPAHARRRAHGAHGGSRCRARAG